MPTSFPGPTLTFFDEWLPEKATPVGYAALIDAYGLKVPLPYIKSAISQHNRDYEKDGWRIKTPRHEPKNSLTGHLTFALKYEGVDLLVLKRLFEDIGPEPVIELINEAPSSAYSRRVWFLYEWLMGDKLDIPDAKEGRYVEVIDTKLQFGGDAKNSSRFRLKDNMPGTREFCPLVRRCADLTEFEAKGLEEQIDDVVAKLPPDVLRRASAFLLLEDTKSSFAIEGERPAQNRLHRWGQAVSQAGEHPISIDELSRLQRIVLEGNSNIPLGLRHEEGFIGSHDRASHEPIPSHISAKAKDVESLVEGLISYGEKSHGHLSPIVRASTMAFGFVFIHPFADGNGRIHRYLIHHVLTESGFTPKGMVFPVSSVMADDISAYRKVLEAYSSRVLPFIKWRPTEMGNVQIDNETIDLYRYFDATPQTEFLAHCIERTIKHDLPNEIRHLEIHDRFKSEVKKSMDLEERLEELAFSFLIQGDGTFSKRARTKELSSLGDDRLEKLEEIYRDVLSGISQPTTTASAFRKL